MERVLTKIVKEIANENGLTFQGYSDDWIIKLSKKNKSCLIYGYVFDCNSCVVCNILKDKNATYEILKSYNIPCVEHWFYYHDLNELENLNSEKWIPFENLLKKYNKLVIKNNVGTGGSNVLLIENSKQLKEQILSLKNKLHRFSICPFYQIEHEFRAIMLNGKLEVAYEKIRPTIIGDGESTTEELIKIQQDEKFKLQDNIDLKYVPKKDEAILLEWKHNLAHGAIPKIIENNKYYSKIKSLAQKICKLLNIHFASIDFIVANNELKVLEINGGVMMEKFATLSDSNYQIAKRIYKKAIMQTIKK